ncbi:hypothetical protein HaLaN_06034 [Haematococcus lacustris]|uniref:Uncharacterized protein n=1 Tax=Haematococcus lacustris TaxID=44745 RepID=A0A699YMY8_HAELA|nr:hypothetical protein HaLaN_06034 [Haematococcus lacustris]
MVGEAFAGAAAAAAGTTAVVADALQEAARLQAQQARERREADPVPQPPRLHGDLMW